MSYVTSSSKSLELDVCGSLVLSNPVTINDWNSLPVDLVEVADADIFRTGLQSLL